MSNWERLQRKLKEETKGPSDPAAPPKSQGAPRAQGHEAGPSRPKKRKYHDISEAVER
jgi:hypothetical protein